MRSGPLFLLVAALGGVAWLAPHLDAGTGSAPSGPASVTPGDEGRTRAAWLAGEIELPRAADGHFYADASVEQHSTHFLIDTGASLVVLTGSDARAVGLSWSDNDLAPIGRGATGPVYGVPVRLSSVELGGMTARDVPAAIIPEGLDVSLLGQSFLSQIGDVRIEGQRMTLGSAKP
ncbi:TIGR02281 family clan AA aspartic protease [Sphingomonas sp. IC081]|uniref:retropepsin-like aspartic protease family protein n=1 Tax=Sphingomonas sp. IC081 TaxID=304378 RepID=UPI001157D0AC|nr:TIGR02281 family clan AA aspartic protease [Sphingomonas sp. IC081]QDK34598.1 TIGR02281 family clan AA aspartic protease [Sphingomonas sp. IC081]